MPKNKNYVGIMLRLTYSETKYSSHKGFFLQTSTSVFLSCAVKEVILLQILSCESCCVNL